MGTGTAIGASGTSAEKKFHATTVPHAQADFYEYNRSCCHL